MISAAVGVQVGRKHRFAKICAHGMLAPADRSLGALARASGKGRKQVPAERRA
jgi:hypothetical protein